MRGALVVAAVLAWAHAVVADEVAVPVPLQAELVAKVAAYDKNFAARAGDKARILLVVKKGDAESTSFGKHMAAALGELPTIGGLAHEETVLPFAGAAELATTCKTRRASIVYLGPGLAPDIEAIRAALDGVNVLSVAAAAEQVPRGIVLGFDLISGKPKILVQLTQAKKQDVAFKAELLKLAKVYE